MVRWEGTRRGVACSGLRAVRPLFVGFNTGVGGSRGHRTSWHKTSHLALKERVAEKARLRHHLFRGGNCPPLPLILLIDVVDNEKVARVESRSRWNCPRVLALTTLSARLIVTNAIFQDKRRHFRWRHVWLLYQQRTRHFWSLGFSAEDDYWEADADICFKFQLIMSTMMDGLVSRSGSGLFWLQSVFALGKHPMIGSTSTSCCVHMTHFPPRNLISVHCSAVAFWRVWSRYFWGLKRSGGVSGVDLVLSEKRRARLSLDPFPSMHR